MRRFVVGLLLPPLTATSLVAQVSPSSASIPEAWREFTEAFDAHAREYALIGGSALLVRDGQVIGRHHFGLADRSSGTRIDDSTVFHWASITKTLTAIAILQLRDRGSLTLDDRIIDWIPELRRIHDPFGTRDSITIRMLLSHSSGFQGGTWPYGRGRPWEPFEPTQWEQLVAMMPYQQLTFPAGSRYGYSNPGFVYLARVIEAISGDSWAVYVQKNIFAPLGLARSYVGTTPYYLAAHRSHNYEIERDAKTGRDAVIDNGADFDPGITISNSGWNAPLDDLATYLAYLTGAAASPVGQTRYDAVLPRASLEEMWEPVVNVAPDSASRPRIDMGLSFFIHHADGRKIIGHTGSQAGFRSFMYFDPERRTAIVWSFNTANPAAEQPAGWARGSLVDAGIRSLR